MYVYDEANNLAKAIQESDDMAFQDILRAANLEPDFIKYIHDENNEYGKANANTKKVFSEMNMNYDKFEENTKYIILKDFSKKFRVLNSNKNSLINIK